MIINSQAKYNLFSHWCFIALNGVVCLAKIRLFGGNIEFVYKSVINRRCGNIGKYKQKDELVVNCDRFNGLKNSSVNPFAFTEQGAMLSALLKSETAVHTSIRIIDAFVAMRNFLMNNALIFQRMERIEMKQLKTDEKVDAILDRLNEPKEPEQGVFFNCQIIGRFWSFVCI